MATQEELSLLEIRLTVLREQILDLQKRYSDLSMEYEIKKAENYAPASKRYTGEF